MTQVPTSHRDLLEVPVATLATIGPDGRPNCPSLVLVDETPWRSRSTPAGMRKTKN